MLIRLLCRFAYVRALLNAIAVEVSLCSRCHGTGVVALPGGTVRCFNCAKLRVLLDGKIPDAYR